MNPPLDTTSPHQAPPYRIRPSDHPRFSETFIVSEILAREAQGRRPGIMRCAFTTDARASTPNRPGRRSRRWVSRPNQTVTYGAKLTGLTRREDRERFASHAGPGRLPSDVVARAWELARQARRDSITHLHARALRASPGRTGGLDRRPRPSPTSLHQPPARHLRSIGPDVQLRRICSSAQRVIAISKFHNGDYLKTVLAGTGGLMSLRYNALELDHFSPPRPAAGVPPRGQSHCSVRRGVTWCPRGLRRPGPRR